MFSFRCVWCGNLILPERRPYGSFFFQLFNFILQLAKILDVTIDELVGMELTTKEAQCLASFKKLDEENQMRILDLMNVLQKS